jgi:hypothetical protein
MAKKAPAPNLRVPGDNSVASRFARFSPNVRTAGTSGPSGRLPGPAPWAENLPDLPGDRLQARCSTRRRP